MQINHPRSYYALTTVLLYDIIPTMSISTVSTKFQATIPEEVRKALGVNIGDKIFYKNIDPKEKRAVIEVISNQNVVDRLYGSLKTNVPYMTMEKARDIAGKALAKKYHVKNG